MHDSNTPCGYRPPPTNLASPTVSGSTRKPPRLTLRFGPDGHTFQALDEHGRDLSDTLRVTAVTASAKCGELAKATIEVEGCEVDASVFVEQPTTGRAVDDALDAAGAPHTDERGSLTAAQRVAWLADQRDKWRACATIPSEVNLHGPHIAEAREPLLADFVSKHQEAYRERARDRVAKAMAQLDMPIAEAREPAPAKPKYDRHAVADRIASIASGLTYNDSAHEGTAKHWLYELASRVRSGSVTCPVDAATKPLHAKIEELEKELKHEKCDVASHKLSIENALQVLRGANAEFHGTLSSGIEDLVRRLKDAEPSVLQDDVRDLLLALGLGDHARSKSPHEVLQSEILPAVRKLVDRQAADIGRLADFVSTHPEAPRGVVGQSAVDVAIRWIGDLVRERAGEDWSWPTNGVTGGTSFEEDLRALINRKSKENGSNTPDYVLADYLCRCLESFDRAVKERQRWHEARPATTAQGSRPAPTTR